MRGRDSGAAGQHVLRLIGQEPLAGFRDADGDHVVFLSVDGGKHGGGGTERDFVLARAATKNDPNAKFPGHRCGQSIAAARQRLCREMVRYTARH
jgi:hypothetical protein